MIITDKSHKTNKMAAPHYTVELARNSERVPEAAALLRVYFHIADMYQHTVANAKQEPNPLMRDPLLSYSPFSDGGSFRGYRTTAREDKPYHPTRGGDIVERTMVGSALYSLTQGSPPKSYLGNISYS